ncbi:MAG: bifunctional diaminohydroxyphosphoribosylaminopyrimidine deaminase/5-amino-6-(5-phosphoribosylamino)uracil reductase RibD [Proteobacteria bacterium]|nr:bifunctional diaminohydroxyphosphoribosylaminopyrimidine deaminase/5-amino-6-(5-phosphoribosylamino)uracil reductase RibD [Pseudomonadota bacterium]
MFSELRIAKVMPMEPLLKKGFGLGGRIERALAATVAPSFATGTDDYWMEQALLESMNGVGITAPNPAVGCVLVENDREISRGHTQEYRKEHAERMAFENRDRGADLSRATAYVTLEPCSHQGHQPPCVDLLLQSPVPRIVIATRDPDPRVNGEGIRRLQEAGKDVILGVLENECRAWHFPFLRSRATGRPVWIAKWAETPAGFLADASGNSKWISNESSRAYTHWLRQKYDAIVVGAGTFLADHPKLTVRDCALPHQRHPERWVFDPKGRLFNLPKERVPGAPLFRPDSLTGFKIAVCESVLKKHRTPPPADWVAIPVEPESPDFWSAFCEGVRAAPRTIPLQSVMVEGGASLLRGLFSEGLVEGVHCFTGQKEFLTRCDTQNQVGPWAGPGWTLQSHQELRGDILREWTKTG